VIPFLRAFFVAFFSDPLAFRRWLRGGFSATVPIAVQLMADPTWPTWSAKQWALRSIPSFFAFAAGSMQSSAKKNGAPPQEAPRGFARLSVLLALIVIATICASCAARRECVRIDWLAVDRAFARAAWKTDHCESLTAAQCRSLWDRREEALRIQRVELDSIIRRNRSAFEAGQR